MLHPAVARDMLNDEVAAARLRLGGRCVSIALVDDTVVVYPFAVGDQELRFEFAGRRFDAEPFAVRVFRGAAVVPVETSNGLLHSVHPVLGRPFVCLQGTYEYHCHSSHLADSWDHHRQQIRLADLLEKMLEKIGR